MDDRLDEARRRGDAPRAPAFVAALVVAGGLLGALLGAAVAPWASLSAGFGLEPAVIEALPDVALPVVLGTALGALLGATLAHLLLDPFRPGLRLRVHRRRSRETGLAALAVVAVAAAVVPALLAAPGGRDPGHLVLGAPVVALGAALLLAVPLAVVARARGRRAWRESVAPDPPPRRRPDEAPPAVRAALIAVGRAPDQLGDLVVVSGAYAITVAWDPPRVVAHGDAALADAGRAAGLPVVAAPALGAALAGVPTGDPLPPRLAAEVRALDHRGQRPDGPL